MRVSPNLNAIHRAVSDANTRAERIAARGATADTTAEDLVAQRTALHEVAVNVQAIRAQDEVLGSLLDVRA